jgi:hypothetical protein
MNKAQQKRFDSLYRKHLSALRRQGKAEATIDAYSRTKSPRVGSLQTPSLVSALRVACCASLLAPGKMVDSVPGHHIF